MLLFLGLLSTDSKFSILNRSHWSQILDLIQSKEYLGSNCSEEGPGLGAAGGSKKTEITIDISIGLNKASQNTASYINSFNPHSTFT